MAAGKGVCGAIFSSAGNGALTASCREIGGCPTGSAVATPSHNLQSVGISHVIHAVGPIWDPGTPVECDRLLAGADCLVLDDVGLPTALRLVMQNRRFDMRPLSV
jgi:O-acetyl-ADP-ribose deacetylase